MSQITLPDGKDGGFIELSDSISKEGLSAVSGQEILQGSSEYEVRKLRQNSSLFVEESLWTIGVDE